MFVLLAFLFHVHTASAQDTISPRPPPLDPAQDFEDMEEDMVELGDEGGPPTRPTMPPPPGMGGAAGGGPAMPVEIRPSTPPPAGAFSNANNKVKFQVVDGAFYEKGKPRGRGKKMKSAN